ncbi:LacI family DNA-binding transcriptional regulator [Psychromonas ossibalaenae]|uniref:LacI family DNA-binding transcriptional regulator n=1 Tax=Psychromonas ossibalaenae TaxID=444922 RepID=UPI000367B73C|nr:LacI family DNA-binding transcriptional regulator [Psychromonas ossibalaenae]
MKKLTIRDIAELAGVGKSTVSRVLNNDPKVKTETQTKIREIIKEVGYKPSAVARAMNNQPIKSIGIVVTRLSSSAENQALSEIIDFFHQHEYEVLVLESRYDSELLNTHIELMVQKQVEGIIFFGFTDQGLVNKELFNGNIVMIAVEQPGISSVTTNSPLAVKHCFEYLKTHGARNIAFLGVHESDIQTGKLRLDAYKEACATHKTKPIIYLTDMEYADGVKGCKALLKAGADAVICGTERLTGGALVHLLREGKSDLPVAAVGINDYIRILNPGIFAADLQYAKVGKEAAVLLFQKMKGNNKNTDTVVEPLMTELAEL